LVEKRKSIYTLAVLLDNLDEQNKEPPGKHNDHANLPLKDPTVAEEVQMSSEGEEANNPAPPRPNSQSANGPEKSAATE